MMTEQAVHAQTLTAERDANAPRPEPDPTTEDVVVLGENFYTANPDRTNDSDDDGETIVRGTDAYDEPDTDTNDDGETIVRGTDIYEEVFDDERLGKAVDSELRGFYALLDLKVKDELMVQLASKGETGINVARVGSLLQSLLHQEQNLHLQNALRIEGEYLPKARLNMEPARGVSDFSIRDVEQLNWHYDLQSELVERLVALAPSTPEEYAQMGSEYTARLLPEAQEAVRQLRRDQEEAQVEAFKEQLAVDDAVAKLTEFARELAA